MINTPFHSIRDTATLTGLSQKFLRDGCKAGMVPHVMSGKKYLVNVPALLRGLNESAEMQLDKLRQAEHTGDTQ